MESPLLAVTGKRKVSSISPDNSNGSPEEKRTREEEFCEFNGVIEASTAVKMDGDQSKKMDIALAKLEKLDLIENRLESVAASISTIEKTVGDVAKLKKKTNDMDETVDEIEKGVKFNEGELVDVKRDVKKVEFDTEDLKKQLLYLEAYSRRENLKFAGIPERLSENHDGLGQYREHKGPGLWLHGETIENGYATGPNLISESSSAWETYW